MLSRVDKKNLNYTYTTITPQIASEDIGTIDVLCRKCGNLVMLNGAISFTSDQTNAGYNYPLITGLPKPITRVEVEASNRAQQKPIEMQIAVADGGLSVIYGNRYKANEAIRFNCMYFTSEI